MDNFSRLLMPCKACIYWEYPQHFNEDDTSLKIMYKKVCLKILLEGDKCIGYIEFAPPMFFKTLGEYDDKWTNIPRKDIAYISCLYIDVNHKGRGYGSLLLNGVIKYLGKLRVKEIYTYAKIDDPNNPSGPLSFWIRNGFKVVDTSIENYPLVKRILKLDPYFISPLILNYSLFH